MKLKIGTNKSLIVRERGRRFCGTRLGSALLCVIRNLDFVLQQQFRRRRR